MPSHVFAGRTLVQDLEHPIQSNNLALRFFEMLLQCLFQFRRLDCLRQPRVYTKCLLFCRINILQLVDKEIVHCFDRHDMCLVHSATGVLN